MRILYDSHTFSEQTFGGISRYFVELMNHLPEGCEAVLPIYASENAYLPQLKNKPHTISLRHFPEHRKLYYFINGFADRRALGKGGYDVFHPTGYDPYFIPLVKSPVVVTVHDMIYHRGLNEGKHTPEIMRNMDRTILAADRIIAISETTKRDVIRFYNIPEEKIDVVYHGFDPLAGNSDRLPYMPERYILFVGQRGGYKNFDILLEAFSMIASKERNLKVVATGRQFSSREKKRIAELGIADRCECRFIPTSDMNALYANAECFVFPSRMEGFGMPVLESFAAGAPSVLADTECFREIAGNGALFFNPDDAAQLADSIVRVISDKKLRETLRNAGKEELKRFSWDKTGLLTAETYRKAVR